MHTWRDLRNRLSLKIDVLKVFILFVVSSGSSSPLRSPAAGLTVCLAVCAARDWKYEGIESREIPRWRTAGKRVGDDHIWITLLWMQQVVSGMISSNVSLWQHKTKIELIILLGYITIMFQSTNLFLMLEFVLSKKYLLNVNFMYRNLCVHLVFQPTRLHM